MLYYSKGGDFVIGNRIKEIRSKYKLSQTEFGKKLGVSRDVIGNLECERVELKNPMSKLICKTFNIREEWLLTGEGEMTLIPDEDIELDKIFSDITSGDSDKIKEIVLKLSKLDEKYLDALNILIEGLIK